MPLPTKGQRTPGAGRRKGIPNRNTKELQELLRSMKCDPRVIMALVVNNELPCGVCRGQGRTPYALKPILRFKCEHCSYNCNQDGVAGQDGQPGRIAGDGKAFASCPQCGHEPEVRLASRICLSCYGSLLENCNPKLRQEAAAELLMYLLPKRKAIELTGADGGPVMLEARLIQEARARRLAEGQKVIEAKAEPASE